MDDVLEGGAAACITDEGAGTTTCEWELEGFTQTSYDFELTPVVASIRTNTYEISIGSAGK